MCESPNNSSSPLSQMRISYDDQFLFSVGLDGSLFAFSVTDKEERGLRREKDIAFAEEVLITKSDLEEKVVTQKNGSGPKLVCTDHFWALI